MLETATNCAGNTETFKQAWTWRPLRGLVSAKAARQRLLSDDGHLGTVSGDNVLSNGECTLQATAFLALHILRLPPKVGLQWVQVKTLQVTNTLIAKLTLGHLAKVLILRCCEQRRKLGVDIDSNASDLFSQTLYSTGNCLLQANTWV